MKWFEFFKVHISILEKIPKFRKIIFFKEVYWNISCKSTKFYERYTKVYLFKILIMKKIFKKSVWNQKGRTFLIIFLFQNKLFFTKLIPNWAILVDFIPIWTCIPSHNSIHLNENFQINNIKAWHTGLNTLKYP